MIGGVVSGEEKADPQGRSFCPLGRRGSCEMRPTFPIRCGGLAVLYVIPNHRRILPDLFLLAFLL